MLMTVSDSPGSAFGSSMRMTVPWGSIPKPLIVSMAVLLPKAWR